MLTHAHVIIRAKPNNLNSIRLSEFADRHRFPKRAVYMYMCMLCADSCVVHYVCVCVASTIMSCVASTSMSCVASTIMSCVASTIMSCVASCHHAPGFVARLPLTRLFSTCMRRHCCPCYM